MSEACMNGEAIVLPESKTTTLGDTRYVVNMHFDNNEEDVYTKICRLLAEEATKA